MCGEGLSTPKCVRLLIILAIIVLERIVCSGDNDGSAVVAKTEAAAGIRHSRSLANPDSGFVAQHPRLNCDRVWVWVHTRHQPSSQPRGNNNSAPAYKKCVHLGESCFKVMLQQSDKSVIEHGEVQV